MQRNIAIWDIICYVAFPLFIWNFARDMIGDYYAMLLSSVPGIIYSAIRFTLIKTINVFGIYMISTLIIGTLIDVLAGSAIQQLWNNVIFSYCLGALYLITILVKRPLPLEFFVDFAELQGYDRGETRKLCLQPKIFAIFKFITVMFAIQYILLASIRVWLIKGSFDKGIVLRQGLAWLISGICIFGYIRINKLMKEQSDSTVVSS